MPLHLPLVVEPDLAALSTAAVEPPELGLRHGGARPGKAESREEEPGSEVHAGLATRRR